MGSALPVGREVLIPRQLSVAIDEGGIRTASGMLPALLYTTEGLERHGQREMVFAVIRTGAPAPGYPLTMARTVHQLAAEGRLVEAGDVSVFGQPGIDIDGRVTGFVYAAAPEDIPSTVRFERPPLVALPLLAGETAVVQRFGHARVLSLLGAQERYYPHPWWFRPGRAPVVDDAEFRAATMLSKAPAYNLPFLRVVHIGDRLELTITAGDATSYIGGADEELEAFEEALREADDVCAFLPGLADVPQTYVWAPGQQGPAAIVAPGGERSTRIGCNFLLLVRGTAEPTARQVEDGFAVLLTGAMYARLRQAVEAGRPIEIGLPAGAVSTLALRLDPRPGPATRPLQAVRQGPGARSEPTPTNGHADGSGDADGHRDDLRRDGHRDGHPEGHLDGHGGLPAGGVRSVEGGRRAPGSGDGGGGDRNSGDRNSGDTAGIGAMADGRSPSGAASRSSDTERIPAARRPEDANQNGGLVGDEGRTPDPNSTPDAGRSVEPGGSADAGLPVDPDQSTRIGRSGAAVHPPGPGSLRDGTRSAHPGGTHPASGSAYPGGTHPDAGSGHSGAASVRPSTERYRTGELTIYHPPQADDTDRSSRGADGRALRHVDRGRIVLLTSEEQLRRATTAAELGDFIDRTRGIVDRAFTGVRHGTEELMVEFHLGPSRPVAVRIMARPEAPPRELQVVLERQLLALRPPTIRYTEVAFQLHLQLYR
ncbi:hypothetical protein ACFO1B_36790 [Dactylosporangium siamense]|uniref:hypothetical protein n=1 Tax=Dactylosporangium siamense TaxID=685454 RepID=UPI00194242F7|nr:hypothetical protein [Dactylosporangium siamense]